MGLKGKKEKAIIKKAEGFLRPGELYVVMTDGLKAVYIENVGEPFVFKGSCGDIVCKSGEVTVVKEEDFVGGGRAVFVRYSEWKMPVFSRGFGFMIK